MNPTKLLSTTCILIGILHAATASATPIQWTLQNVVFDDGGTASGSFIYDADTSGISSFLITTSGGAFSATYTEWASVDPDFIVSLVDEPPSILGLQLDAPMTNSGGVISISPDSLEYWAVDFDEFSRFVVSGQISAVAVVPVPAAIWMLGGALGVLGLVRRRTKAAA
ncbi:MAG: VPLPA-CTERM sorting domain-containing protein [Gammaproteobacteria bacterium]|nr:VPLPA-CTERM sorting domain-containing protein [Gammaproteobacteria bacterium]